MAPAVYLNRVNKPYVNDLERKTTTPAFDLFSFNKPVTCTPNDAVSLVDISCSERLEHVTLTPSIYGEETYSASSSQSIDDTFSQEDEEYYVIESYQDLVGDGIDLFRGQKVKVIEILINPLALHRKLFLVD